MSHYNGPKGRINRRLGVAIYETAGAMRALERRPNPPGMHPRPRKLSGYGAALQEKQKLKHFYGLSERTLRRLFDKARRRKGNTGEALVELCERRLDNIVRRAGLTKTRSQSRQGITHGHFLVNGRKVDSPSFLVRAGDVIDVKNRANLIALYAPLQAASAGEAPGWLSCDSRHLRVTVQALPTGADCSAPVSIDPVIEILSR